MSTSADIHNRLAPEMVIQIIKQAGSPQDALVLLESLTAGVCTYIAAATTGGQTAQQVFDLIASAMPDRLADLGSKVLVPKGSA